MSNKPMLISSKLHSFRNFSLQRYSFLGREASFHKKVLSLRDD